MTREEHIYQLKQYLQGKSISMCPASSLYWQEHWEEVIKALEQEPKPMVEIDLYSVIKQIYIEREVLDKIRAEIDEVYEELDGCDPDSLGTFACRIDDIIDKYKTESETQ